MLPRAGCTDEPEALLKALCCVAWGVCCAAWSEGDFSVKMLWYFYSTESEKDTRQEKEQLHSLQYRQFFFLIKYQKEPCLNCQFCFA